MAMGPLVALKGNFEVLKKVAFLALVWSRTGWKVLPLWVL